MRPTSGSIQRSKKAMKSSVGDFEGGGVYSPHSSSSALVLFPYSFPFRQANGHDLVNTFQFDWNQFNALAYSNAININRAPWKGRRIEVLRRIATSAEM
jgi:hypothetical protein